MNIRRASSPSLYAAQAPRTAPFPASLLPAFENALKQQRIELLQEMQTALSAGEAELARAPGSEGSSDTKDVAAHGMQADAAAVNIDRLHSVVAAVDDALSRLRRGVFALCARCGTNIPVARLYAQPTAACCKRCQGVREHAAPKALL
jgi:DnaK suppressor protein